MTVGGWQIHMVFASPHDAHSILRMFDAAVQCNEELGLIGEGLDKYGILANVLGESRTD